MSSDITQSPTLQLQRTHYNQAQNDIVKALDLDDVNEFHSALDFYLKGVQGIKAALRLKFSDEER